MWQLLALLAICIPCYATTQNITNYPYIISDIDFDTNVSVSSNGVYKETTFTDDNPTVSAELLLTYQDNYSLSVTGNSVKTNDNNAEFIFKAKAQTDFNIPWQKLAVSLRSYTYNVDSTSDYNDILFRYDMNIADFNIHTSVDFEFSRPSTQANETVEIGFTKPFYTNTLFAYAGRHFNKGDYIAFGLKFNFAPYTITLMTQEAYVNNSWTSYPVFSIGYSSVGTNPYKLSTN